MSKAAPKFKVGDWIVEETSNPHKMKITAVGLIFYRYTIEDDETEYPHTIEFIDKHFNIKPKEVTITRKKLADAWDSVEAPFVECAQLSKLFESLCKELGL